MVDFVSQLIFDISREQIFETAIASCYDAVILLDHDSSGIAQIDESFVALEQIPWELMLEEP